MECQCMKLNIFALQGTYMEVSIRLSCWFVHEPPYQLNHSMVLQFRFSM